MPTTNNLESPRGRERNPDRTYVRRYAPAFVYAVLSVIAIYPVLITDIPSLVDYPAHLAGIHIQMAIADNPALQAHYTLHWRPLPNLAMEVVVPLLVRVVSLFDAGRIFIGAAILLPVAGTVVLRKVLHGRVGYAPAFAFIPAYNIALAWGFLNFLVGSGLCLLAFAGWIASRHWRAPARMVLFSAVALVLYFTHLLAFAAYAVMVAAFALQPVLASARWFTRRNLAALAIDGAQFIGPALLLLPALFSGEAGYSEFKGVASRFKALFSPAYSVGSAADLLVFILAVMFLYWAVRNRRITLVPEIRLPLISIILFAAVIPEWLMQAWGANIRLPTIAVLIVLAAARLQLPPMRGQLVLSGVFFVLFIIRVWDVSEFWVEDAHKFAEFRAAAASIPVGARVIPVQAKLDGTLDIRGGFAQAYWTMPTLLAIDRSAFIPNLFTDASKHLVSVTPANYQIDTPFGRPADLEQTVSGAAYELRGAPAPFDRYGSREFWTDWPHRFDYMVVVNETRPILGLEPLLQPVHRGSFFAIYRIVPGSCSIDPTAQEDYVPFCTRDG